MQFPGFTKAFAVTPHDTNPFTPGFTVKALFIGVTGNISIVPSGQTTAVVFKGLPAGAVLHMSVNRVKSTDTTATDIVALGD